jgi:amidohydrolase
MASLLCVARVLSTWDVTRFRKAVVLLFQPGEEGHHGARLMVEQGCLESVTHVFGIHLWSTLPLYQVGLDAGPVMANSDRFAMHVLGRGGHGSMPHDTADPVVAAAALVLQAQHVVSRNVDPCKAAVVSFGGVRSSSEVANVIPESVQLVGKWKHAVDIDGVDDDGVVFIFVPGVVIAGRRALVSRHQAPCARTRRMCVV